MKITLSALVILAFAMFSCSSGISVEESKNEIIAAEKAFEKMASDSGIAAAFYFFADDNAVIMRGNDSLIKGKEGIRNFYRSKDLKDVHLTWSPDYVGVAGSGDMGYSYGKYTWRMQKENDSVKELKGVFHTVWKKQKDGSWKYLWD